MSQNNVKIPCNKVYVEKVFKFLEMEEDYELYISNQKDYDFWTALEPIVGKPLNLVFYEEDSCCPICNGKSIKNGRRTRFINRNKPVKIQKYRCLDKKCNNFFETNLEKIVPKNSNYAYKIRYEPVELLLIDYFSLEKISEEIKSRHGCKPCRQTILNHKIEVYRNHYESKIKEELKYSNEELSGVYGYDEQFPSVNGESRVRLALLDVNTNIILNQWVVKEFKTETVEKFLNMSLKDKRIETIVTDGYSAYDQIIGDLNAKHQLCTFHIMHNLMTDVIKIQNRIKRKIKTKQKKIQEKTNKIKHTHEKKRKKETVKEIKLLKIEVRELKREQKEWEKIIERISNIFKADTAKKARTRFNILFNNIKHLPQIIGKFLNKLKKKLEKAINHITFDNIPSTNNKKERHFGVTLPGFLKKRFRTDEGLEMHLKFTEYRWIKRNKKTVTF
jgi:hypothetical protein